MKRILLISGLVALSLGAAAQNMYDALTYATDDNIGSARTMGMGNAVTATGGDIATLVFNPAGSAVAGYSQISITPALNISCSSAVGTTLSGQTSPYCYDNRVRTKYAKFALPDFGITYNCNTGRKSGLVSYTFGIVYNAKSYYQNQTKASGVHSGTSLAQYFANEATGIDISEFQSSSAYQNLPSNLYLAYSSGMISPISSASDVYVGATEKYIEDSDGNREFFVPGALNQEYGRQITGRKGDYVFNFGMNFSNLVYVGANVGITDLTYNFDEYQIEKPVDSGLFEVNFGDEGTTYFKSLQYKDWYTTTGMGAYFKFGFIVTPGPVRLAATIQSPTYFTMKDEWGATASTIYDNPSYSAVATSDDYTYSYRYVSPWKTSVGIAGTIAKKAVISADYEFSSNKSMYFSDGTYENSNFSEVNTDIKNCMGSTHELRIGAEYKPVNCLALRAGYNLNAIRSGNKSIASDGYETVARSLACSNSASLGVGYYSSGAFFADLAFRALFSPKEYIYPYPDYAYSDGQLVSYSPEICTRRIFYTVALTIGMRF